MRKQEVRKGEGEEMGQKLVQMETFLGTRNLKGGSCHGSESNPQFSPAFIRLLNNLRDYNTPKSIYSPGQVITLHK